MKKLYIVVNDRNFAAFVFYRNQLNIFLNLRRGKLDDPKNIAEDMSESGHWATGDYRVTLRDFSDTDNLLPLIKQSFYKN